MFNIYCIILLFLSYVHISICTKALEEAKAAQAKVANGETFRLVVEAELAKGERENAAACATQDQ